MPFGTARLVPILTLIKASKKAGGKTQFTKPPKKEWAPAPPLWKNTEILLFFSFEGVPKYLKYIRILLLDRLLFENEILKR